MNFVSKDDIVNYPLIDFNGEVHVIDKKKDVRQYCDIISKSSIVGFDTETKPAFQKGISHPISLIQLSVDNSVFLFRINKVGFDNNIINITPKIPLKPDTTYEFFMPAGGVEDVAGNGLEEDYTFLFSTGDQIATNSSPTINDIRFLLSEAFWVNFCKNYFPFIK